MEVTVWLSYVAMITALIAFPGPSSLLVTVHGYQYGFRTSNYTIIANLLGSLVLMALSALGLGVLISTSATLFTVVKLLGAAYLIYMGVKMWFSTKVKVDANGQGVKGGASKYALIKQGFFTGVSNPKDLMFFAALFPVFLNANQPILGQLLILMLTWLVIDYAIKVVYSLTGKRIHKQLSSESFVKLFNRVTGSMFVMAGAALASSSHR